MPHYDLANLVTLTKTIRIECLVGIEPLELLV
jgi:hypothetical protein